MATVVDFTLPANEFALRETLMTIEDARFEAVRIVAHGTDTVLPLVLATAPDSGTEALIEAVDADASVANLVHLTDFNGECLLKMEWVDEIQVIVNILVEQAATILSAHGSGSGYGYGGGDGTENANANEWHFRTLFPDREAISATYDFCRASDLHLTVRAIRDVDAPGRAQYGLSATQYESLIAAFEASFYTVPRTITLGDLADELNVSHQALSERLRRGHANLIEATLISDQQTRLGDQKLSDEL